MHEYGHHSPLKYRITFRLNFTKNVILFPKNTSNESVNAEGSKMAVPIYSKVSLLIHSAAPPILLQAVSYLLIIFMSAIVTYQSCLRSSTIYFFEVFSARLPVSLLLTVVSFSWILRMYSSWSDGIQLQCPSCFLLCCY